MPLVLGRTVGPSTYNSFAQPLGVVMLALIAVCPLLAWRKTEGAALRGRLILPAASRRCSRTSVAGAGLPVQRRGFIGLVVCGFACGAVIQFVLRSARRAAGPDASLWSGMGRAFTGSRTPHGSFVVHFGMVLVMVGLIGSNVYKVEQCTIVNGRAGRHGLSWAATR